MELIVALDNIEAARALAVANDLRAGGVQWLKVGLELYTKSGPQIVRDLRAKGFKIFLDLKLLDIPNTVAKASAAAAETGAELLTLHCAGGSAMLKAAADAVSGSPLKLLGVTVLTSFGDQDVSEIASAWGSTSAPSRDKAAQRFARIAAESRIHGIVCSVPDLATGAFTGLFSPALFVTPGIRGPQDPIGDQKSVATIEQAKKAGSTHIVMGRPILQPADGNICAAAKRAIDAIKGA